MAFGYLLEDGSGRYLLEDGSGIYLLEEQPNMISQLIEPLSAIISELPFVDKYGGLVQTATRLVEAGTTADDEPIYREERFPVACGLTPDECWDQGMYQDLIPDDRYKSVVYFEEVEGLRYVQTQRLGGSDFYTFRQRLRLVAWLNLPKLGIDSCDGSYVISFSFLKNLMQEWKGLEDPFPILKLTSTMVMQEPKHLNPFEKYSYQDLSEMWMYPYDYMSFIVDIEATVAANCIPEYEEAEALEC